jgi:hypothetical protein
LTTGERFSIERLAGTPSPDCNTPLHGGGKARDSLDYALDHRSSSMRFLRWTHPALCLLGLLALVLAGCRSNAQQDLIARELRMQEDQLYAMEDYISQYQQLVCKYRSENAALRRQMADGYYEGDADELPRPGSSVRPGDERSGPTFRAPQTPQRNEPASDDIEIQVPDVPPLEGSTSTEHREQIATASYTESINSDGEAASAAVEKAAQQSTTTDNPPNPVSLRGEVIANDSGGGSRLMVDVERLNPSGQGTEFDGKLSLLLLERSEDNIPQNLARWDFSADDVQSAAEPSAGEHAMRFYLELPADTPDSHASEIWVRLLPRDGKKLLAHADIDLRQPGEFASQRVAPSITTTQTAPTKASSQNLDDSSSVPSTADSNAGKGEWTTARTGPIADLTIETDAGTWRASSEPMPVVQSSFATARVSRPVQRAAFFDKISATKPPRTYTRPTWSPDRTDAAKANSDSTRSRPSSVSQRPVWTDTR